MMRTVVIILECLAVACSICAWLYILVQVLKAGNRTEACRWILVSLLLFFLSLFVSLRLIHRIETVEYRASFVGCAPGIQSVFYPVPYDAPPHLEFVTNDLNPPPAPKILEQRADGFKVKTDKESRRYTWKATGMRKL